MTTSISVVANQNVNPTRPTTGSALANTGSDMQLLGMLGFGALVTGTGIFLLRRRVTR